MPCHLKGGMPQEFLKRESVPAAINKILAGEGMAECVNAGFLDAPPLVIAVKALPQGFLCQHIPVFITEKIVGEGTLADSHIITEDICHKATQRDDLNLPRFGMAERHLPPAQINISVLNVADGGGTTAAI